MSFAHYSEKIFSEHLDLFNIQWIYEPTSFPLKWGSGSIKMMFTPDFYLPELDVYVEITTMNQNLITKKQKKLKLAKKLYPNKNFKLINESQFYSFLNSDNEVVSSIPAALATFNSLSILVLLINLLSVFSDILNPKLCNLDIG